MLPSLLPTPQITLGSTALPFGSATASVAALSLTASPSIALIPAANTTPLTISGYSLTGSNTQPLTSLTGTLNTSGVVPYVWGLNMTTTAYGANSALVSINGGVAGTTNYLTILASGNVGIRTTAPVAVLDVVTGVGNGTGNEADTFRLLSNSTAGNAMTLQMGVNNNGVGGANQGYSYLQSTYWGGGNNPLLLNPKGASVGINQVRAQVPLDVVGTIMARPTSNVALAQTGQIGFNFYNYGNTATPAYVAGINEGSLYSGMGLIFATANNGSDVSGINGTERMRISSTGSVGIGNTLPQALLHIGSTAGTARIYNSFTDASNGEWAYLGSWGPTANVATFGTDKNGTGTNRPVALVAGGIETARLCTNGDFQQGTGSALAISAVAGFLSIATCAGTPTGAPTNAAIGVAEIIYDTTGKKFWIYDQPTTSWKGVVVA